MLKRKRKKKNAKKIFFFYDCNCIVLFVHKRNWLIVKLPLLLFVPFVTLWLITFFFFFFLQQFFHNRVLGCEVQTYKIRFHFLSFYVLSDCDVLWICCIIDLTENVSLKCIKMKKFRLLHGGNEQRMKKKLFHMKDPFNEDIYKYIALSKVDPWVFFGNILTNIVSCHRAGNLIALCEIFSRFVFKSTWEREREKNMKWFLIFSSLSIILAFYTTLHKSILFEETWPGTSVNIRLYHKVPFHFCEVFK